MHQLGQVDGLALRSKGVRLDPAEAEQVGHQPIESLGLIGDHREQVSPGQLVIRRTVAQVGDDRTDHGERRPQVVRDRSQHGVALLAGASEVISLGGPLGELLAFAGHGLKPLGEIAQMVLALLGVEPSVPLRRHQHSDRSRDGEERAQGHPVLDGEDGQRAIGPEEGEIERRGSRDAHQDSGGSAADGG